MENNEIVAFRRFMRNKGILDRFEYCYEQNKLDERDINEYYESVSPRLVILTAFDFEPYRHTIFNAEYWENINDKWQKCVDDYKGGIMPAPNMERCEKCGEWKYPNAFRFNKYGVRHKFCAACEDGMSMKATQKKAPATNDVDEFQFIDFEKTKGGNRRLKRGEAILNYRAKFTESDISFGVEDSREIKAAGMNYLRVCRRKSDGKIGFVFNKEQGLEVRYNSNNIVVRNKHMLEFIINAFALKSTGRYVLDIGNNKANSDDYMTFFIKLI